MQLLSHERVSELWENNDVFWLAALDEAFAGQLKCAKVCRSHGRQNFRACLHGLGVKLILDCFPRAELADNYTILCTYWTKSMLQTQQHDKMVQTPCARKSSWAVCPSASWKPGTWNIPSCQVGLNWSTLFFQRQWRKELRKDRFGGPQTFRKSWLLASPIMWNKLKGRLWGRVAPQ